MTNDTKKRAWAASEAPTKPRGSPALSELRRLTEWLERDKKMMRAALGPIEEFRRAGIFDLESPLRRQMDSIQRLTFDYETAFRLPELGEIDRLTEQLRASALETVQGYGGLVARIQQAMEATRAPWLKMGESLQSVEGFAKLHGMGHALRTLPPFGEQLTKLLSVRPGTL